MINYNKIINKILEFDNLHLNIDIKKFNDEEREMLKLVCYKNQQLNFQYNFIQPFNKKIFFLFFKIKRIFSIQKKIKRFIVIILSFFKKKPILNLSNSEIIFILSLAANIQKDTIPIIDRFKKKIILVDMPFKKYKDFKEIFKDTKIINLRDYIQAKDYFFSLIKTFKFLTKFFLFKKKNTHPLMNFATYFDFFLRINVYKKLLKKIKTNKIFIDRIDGHGISFLLSKFRQINNKNKVISYSPVGLALNNDLISAHYLYANLDYLFCYGKLDKIFIKKLFKKNKLKLLNIPKKIFPIGSVRNSLYKKKLQYKKKLKNKKFNFLYIKSNPNSFFYDNLDYKCFEKFCIFIKKNFPKSKILVKERYGKTSTSNNFLIYKKILKKQNIYQNKNLVPEDLFEKADFLVGTTSSSLATGIFYNIPLICLDNKIIISSFLKYFCSIYVESIDNIGKYKNKIIEIFNTPKSNFQNKKFLFEPAINPHLKIVNFIKNL